MDIDKQIDMLVCSDNKKAYNVLKELIEVSKQCNDLYQILYLIFDYPHKHYTFKYFEV